MSNHDINTDPQASELCWSVYLLRCADNSLYCGITNNLSKRLKQHNGELVGGAKYTKSRQPCRLVYSEQASSRSHASQREYQIKRLSKAEKERLAQAV
ncbi:GIY-YIG nuclease family protein [Thiomicrorhabdus xiamenensis]|uniref:GIY-YIG nuclease family protein n=1 Tax=Thiomicrorhabdus xiamenensis TaxID=2739063 RepID=A0A7D4NRL5_9GAMM|nr:GIY-YIG nuclease family protein [Thiomicrorhabdus xiamenensis]QKI89972.1 GIY-YIG nuclease family protein [Thiomicrorhabdus xiamenensis]